MTDLTAIDVDPLRTPTPSICRKFSFSEFIVRLFLFAESALPSFVQQLGQQTCSAFDAARFPVCVSYGSVTTAGLMTLGVLIAAGLLIVGKLATRA
jgi:hypothetical protein